MGSSKNSKAVIEILQSMIESTMLKPEQKKVITETLRRFKKNLQVGNHRQVSQSADDISRRVVEIIRDDERRDG